MNTLTMLRYLFSAGLIFFFWGANVNAADLTISVRQGVIGEVVPFSILTTSAPTPVKAFTIFVKYNPLILDYQGYQRTDLTEKCSLFYVNNNAPGEVKVLGVDTSAILNKGDSGEFVRLAFQVIGEGDCEITFTAIKDDIESWKVKNGQFTGIEDRNQNDLNDEDEVNPGIKLETNDNSGEETAEVDKFQSNDETNLNTATLEQFHNPSLSVGNRIADKSKGLESTDTSSGRKKPGNDFIPTKGNFDFISDKPDSIVTKSSTRRNNVRGIKQDNSPVEKFSIKNREVKDFSSSPDKSSQRFNILILSLLFLIFIVQVIILIKLYSLGISRDSH